MEWQRWQSWRRRVSAQPAAACGYGGFNNPVARFALADCVVVGKVTVIEEKTVAAVLPGTNGQRGTYHVAVIKVKEMLKGERLTHIRIGLPHQQILRPGYEACFFLTEHPAEPFYLQGVSLYDFPIYKQANGRFLKQWRPSAGWPGCRAIRWRR